MVGGIDRNQQFRCFNLSGEPICAPSHRFGLSLSRRRRITLAIDLSFVSGKRGPNVGAGCAGVLGEKGEDALVYERACSPMRRIEIIVLLP